MTVPGLGGGGSHIVQQLAHIGFQDYVLYDDDVVEESNPNRLIGAKFTDVLAETPKLHLAKMMIYGPAWSIMDNVIDASPPVR